MDFFEGTLVLRPEHVNPGILWFGALSLLAPELAP
jgi:hypothetical protein